LVEQDECSSGVAQGEEQIDGRLTGKVSVAELQLPGGKAKEL
jgi:hypothetical protein